MDEILESSVQKQPPPGRTSSFVLKWASYEKLLPRWWSRARDIELRDYWKQEDYIASTVYSVVTRNAQFEWQLEGLEEDVGWAQRLLQGADFGNGWSEFITKTSIDLLTTDNGAFWEVIRPAKVDLRLNGEKVTLPAIKRLYESDKEEWYAINGSKMIPLRDREYKLYDMPLDLPVGIAHLDSGQCQRTGNSDVPVIYTDRYGKMHKLKWWQVISFTDMPSPIQKMNGVGFCAVSRAFRTSHVLQSIEVYKDEKTSGRNTRKVYITNADPDLLNDQIEQTQSAANNKGYMRFMNPVIATTFDPSTTPAVAEIDLAGVPDGFDEDTTKNWAIAVLANSFGVDYGFLAPLPGKGLGTASQSETQAKQAKGKSSLQFQNMITQALNFRGILPESVQFNYVENDIDAKEKEQKISKQRVDEIAVLVDKGIITSSVARQMLSDSGQLNKTYLSMMNEQDETPVETTEGNQNVEAEDAVEEEMQKCNCDYHHIKVKKIGDYKLNYEKIAERQEKLFKEKNLAQKILYAARQTFWKKKQVEIPETPSTQVNVALENYASEIEELALLAQSGELEKQDFIEALTDLVISSIIAIYAQEAGIPPEEVSEADLTPLENIIAQNEESIQNLADDIYDGRYDEEDGLGIPGLIIRLGLWVSSAASTAWLGMIFNEDNAESKFRWILDPFKENCESCLALNGQVHTGQEWSDFGVYPKSSQLICTGFYCGCSLKLVSDDTETSGDLGSVPLR